MKHFFSPIAPCHLSVVMPYTGVPEVPEVSLMTDWLYFVRQDSTQEII